MIIIRFRGPGVPISSRASRRSIISGLAVVMALTGTPPEFRGYAAVCARASTSTYILPGQQYDIAVRIQRGGGIWPCEAPATSRKGTVPIPSGSNYEGLGDVERAAQTSDHRPRRRFFIYAARVSSLQGMSDQL